MDDLTDFISYTEAEKINQDQMKGLDSWLSPTDENILQYYKKNVKNRHWSYKQYEYEIKY
jgi:hypothetical protein